MLKYLDMNHHSTRWTCSARQARHLYISFGLSSLGHISNVDVMYGPDTNQTIASLTHEIILLIQFGIWKWWMLAFTWSTNGKLNHNQQNKYCLRLFRVRFRLWEKPTVFKPLMFSIQKSLVFWLLIHSIPIEIHESHRWNVSWKCHFCWKFRRFFLWTIKIQYTHSWHVRYTKREPNTKKIYTKLISIVMQNRKYWLKTKENFIRWFFRFLFHYLSLWIVWMCCCVCVYCTAQCTVYNVHCCCWIDARLNREYCSNSVLFM